MLGRGDAGIWYNEGDRHFIQHRMRLADNGDFADSGHFHHDTLDFRGGDILAANLQHILVAIGKLQEPVFPQSHAVAGAEQAALVVALGGCFRIVEV